MCGLPQPAAQWNGRQHWRCWPGASGQRRITVGADQGYDTRGFIKAFGT